MPACLEEIERIYRRLDVHFDHTLGESFYNPMLPGVVEELLAKGIAQKSEGAVAIFFGEKAAAGADPEARRGLHLHDDRPRDDPLPRRAWKPDAILYVVDARQALHFKNLFAIARRWGYDKVALEHISFGSVLGEDRQPLEDARRQCPRARRACSTKPVQRARDVYEADSRRSRRRRRGSPRA